MNKRVYNEFFIKMAVDLSNSRELLKEKTELVYNEKFQTRTLTRLVIFEYLEIWYHRKRKRSTLG